jgi:hypothetical protein
MYVYIYIYIHLYIFVFYDTKNLEVYIHERLFPGPFSLGKDALSHISNSDVKTSLFESIAYKEAEKNHNRNPFLVVLNQRHFAFSHLLSTDDVAINNGIVYLYLCVYGYVYISICMYISMWVYV